MLAHSLGGWRLEPRSLLETGQLTDQRAKEDNIWHIKEIKGARSRESDEQMMGSDFVCVMVRCWENKE